MLKKIFTTSGLLGMALLGMVFVFIRLSLGHCAQRRAGRD